MRRGREVQQVAHGVTEQIGDRGGQRKARGRVTRRSRKRGCGSGGRVDGGWRQGTDRPGVEDGAGEPRGGWRRETRGSARKFHARPVCNHPSAITFRGPWKYPEEYMITCNQEK
jgi:hypothetical protein